LFLQIVYMIVFGGCMVLWFGTFFLAFAHQTPTKSAPPPPAFFILFPLMWIGSMGMWVFMLVIAIVYGIRAGRGEWAEYPLLGRLSRRILKIGPGGIPLTT
jgi:hypothetical protein